MIAIEKIIVENYRKFRCEKISMSNEVTAIAGANNAGKTSLVELLSTIFLKEKRDLINIEDLNNKARQEDEEMLNAIIYDGEIDEETRIGKLTSIHKKLNKIRIGIAIKYDDDNDNLEYFSNYLADVDETKKNYYFLIEYEYLPAKEQDIEEMLKGTKEFKELYSSLQSKVYYCDEEFENKVQIANKMDFYNLFNYHCVYAIRKLSDTSDEKQNFLSKHLLKTVKNNEMWQENLKGLILNINQLLNNQDLSSQIDEITIRHIKSTLESFSKTNGGNTGNLGIDFKLENKDIEKVLIDFIQIYFEQDEGTRIKEQKQGLGYSNLIYLLLEGQIFREKIDPRKVNLLVFEEPEAHLHPQMENIFIRYINNINKVEKLEEVVAKEVEEVVAKGIEEVVAKEVEEVVAKEVEEVVAKEIEEVVAKGIKEVAVTEAEATTKEQSMPFQMLITTHSSEMTKTISLENIRVLRPIGHTESKVYDLHKFMINLSDENKSFYQKFFQFNMIEIVFADKVILFEGDAERLLLKYLISNISQYEALSSQYISYIQVGGAYAYKYLELIEYLQIKSLIFTDIDYVYEKEDINKESVEIIKEVKKRKTTNLTIEKVVEESIIDKIYKKALVEKGTFLENKNVCVKFQTDNDGYARTLEDALLCKLLNFENVFSKIDKGDFASVIREKNLLLSNTNKKQTTLRDRIDKLKNKTDFMYSLIENGQISNAIPNYIEEGLNWLKD
ncbi:AAA family ATPase [Bacillus cereus]|uniref:AAA family ATPase n=1 Tax=Bacillus cereus TaxID=1396 RepID=UPI0015D47151|nr:AAA family ATPase [Bacillus cereus]